MATVLLNMFLYTLSVIMFICAVVSLLFLAFPFFLVFMFLFSVCYFAIRYDGSMNAKHHVIHFAGAGNEDEDDGDEDEPTPDYKPYNRENFKFN